MTNWIVSSSISILAIIFLRHICKGKISLRWQYPFFEHRAKLLSDSFKDENCRVFSMTEIESFLEQLPRVAVLAVFLALPVVIWICSCVMVQEASKYRDLLLVNVGIAVGTFEIFIVRGKRRH